MMSSAFMFGLACPLVEDAVPSWCVIGIEPTLDLSTVAIAEHAHDSSLRIDALARAHDAQSARDRSVRTRGPRRARRLSCEDGRARPQYCVATADVSGHLMRAGHVPIRGSRQQQL